MAGLVLLPSTTYQPPSPSQARRRGQALNTIIEENEETSGPLPAPSRRKNMSSEERIEQWLSPMSDHFPTPRGIHFLAAPILPSSPSSSSADDAESDGSSNQNSWNRTSTMTDATEFDDLYDVSEDEDARHSMLRPESTHIMRRHSSRRRSAAASSVHPDARKALAPLVIPAGDGTSSRSPSVRDLKKMASPIPPTPPPRVDMSPAMMSFMQAQQSQEVPTISAPPSLDGSLSSDQMAAMSAPPTPVIGCKEDQDEEWGGVQLQPGALATLHALSSGDEESEFGEERQQHHHHHQAEQVIELPREEMSEMRRATPHRLVTSLQRATVVPSPSQQRSLAGLTKLDIPSPGGFFSGLSPRTRHTWHMPTPTDEEKPPTSTTAEQFYKAPWVSDVVPTLPPPPPCPPTQLNHGNFSSSPVEQLVDYPEHVNDALPTAIRIVPTPDTARRIPPAQPSATLFNIPEPSSPGEEVVATEIVVDYDPEYARKQQTEALSNISRTEMWLMAQRSYLNGIVGSRDGEDEEAEMGGVREEHLNQKLDPVEETEDSHVKTENQENAIASTGKKTVRFSEVVKTTDIPRCIPAKFLRQENAYYRAFQEYIIRSAKQDSFVHRLPRFEAVQASRVSLKEAHHAQLLGKFQLSVVPQSAKKRMSANVARGDDVLIDNPEKIRHEKEIDALRQMGPSNWHVQAVKLLNGGKLITAPVAERLARLSRMAPGKDGIARDRARILDLGGQATCDWAWHCAMQYPNTKVYTVTTKAIRQLSNSNMRGPPNHRQVAVERLTRLPFADDQFDLVSARELQTILKSVGENGEDEWESCLQECMRVLKPGGFLEFSVLDSDIMNAGSQGLAKSVEFGFNLKTLGYDPSPSKLFLGRLARAGFEDVRRAWTCMPMGPKQTAAGPRNNGMFAHRDSTGSACTLRLEAMVQGSADNIAAVTGLAAGWSWERWLLRCEMEKVNGELRLADLTTSDAVNEAAKCLEGVHAIMEEGRARGAGWRMLQGYARKPKPEPIMDMISICLDTDSLF